MGRHDRTRRTELVGLAWSLERGTSSDAIVTDLTPLVAALLTDRGPLVEIHLGGDGAILLDFTRNGQRRRT